MTKKKAIEQARYIFTTGKLLRRHIFTSMAKIEAGDRACTCSELSMAQFNLLMTVQSHENITVGELAAELGVSPPAVSVMVERLVERGFLVRERLSEDRRKVVLQMSQDEALHFARIEEQVLASFVDLVEEVGKQTAEQWVEVLQQVEEVLKRQGKRNTKGT